MTELVTELIIETGWAQVEAHRAIWPCDRLHASAPVPVVSPFQEQPFVSHALGLPLTARWDARAATHYLRSKAAVASLIDPPVLDVFPPYKEGFATNLRTSTATRYETPRLVEIGLVGADHLITDTAVALTVQALEHWVDGALRRGYAPVRS